MLQPEGSVIELCHVVADMDRAIAHWTGVMGAGPFFVAEMRMEHLYRGRPASMAIKVGFAFTGGLLIELIESLQGDDSVFREVMDKRGEGYHHVMLRLPYDEGFKKLTEAGFKPALESTTPLGERAVLFDTQDANGGFIELMDLHISFSGMVQRMSDAHQDWDRKTDPVRPLYDLMTAA